jgi:hypothetical protein
MIETTHINADNSSSQLIAIALRTDKRRRRKFFRELGTASPGTHKKPSNTHAEIDIQNFVL